jgi:hypothetical protein
MTLGGTDIKDRKTKSKMQKNLTTDNTEIMEKKHGKY